MVRTTTIRLENGEEREMLELDIKLRKDGVVEYKADGVILDPKLMTTGEPQVFKFFDKYMMAVKSEDGNLDLYFLESDDDEEAE